MLRHGILIAAAGLCLAPSALDAALLVPGGLANTEGSANNSIPFNTNPGVTYRYQQVYGGSEFGGGPILINGISFRPDGGFPDIATAFSTNLNIQIDLSTTAVDPDLLNLNFASNLGADLLTVFSGPVTLSSSDTGAGPRDFDITIVFTTPFLFNPTLGNLLLDIRNFTGGVTTPFDAHASDTDAMSRVWGSLNSSVALARDTTGLVTQFDVQAAVPEPGSIMLLSLGLIGLAAGRRRRNG